MEQDCIWTAHQTRQLCTLVCVFERQNQRLQKPVKELNIE